MTQGFKFSRRALLGAVGALVAFAVPAWAAMRVQPMSYELEPSGSKASRDIRVENTGDRPLPIEIRVERRRIGPNGEDLREPAESDFLIFPPQGVVPPNGFQTIRVQYIGDPSIAVTALYVVTISQVPVTTTADQQSGVQLLVNLGTAVAVSPAGASASIAVTSVEPAAEGHKLRVTVANEGTKFARLSNGRWTFTAGGKTVLLEGEELRTAVQQPLIEPGKSRVLELPVSADFPLTGVSATFEYMPPATS